MSLLNLFIFFFIKLVRFLRNFLQTGPTSTASFAEFALRRTYRNGSRYEPLSLEEIGALQQAQPLEIRVRLFHGPEEKTIQSDPATTAEEVCTELARQSKITSTFGWSLFVECKNEVKFKQRNKKFVRYENEFLVLGLFSRL